MDIIATRGFAADFKSVVFHIHTASNKTLGWSAGLELLQGKDPSCNTQALDEETLMGGHKAF